MSASSPSSSLFSPPSSSPSSSGSALVPSAPEHNSTQAQSRRFPVMDQDDDDFRAQMKEDIRRLLYIPEVEEVLNHCEESCVARDITVYDVDEDGMDLWDEDEDDEDEDDGDEFLELDLPGAGFEGLIASNSMQSPMDYTPSTSTFDSTPVWSSSSSFTGHIRTQEEIEEYDHSITFFYQTLAVACIIIESYLTAYHRVHPIVRFEDITVHLPPPRYGRPTLIEYVLGGPGSPVNLIPLSDLQNIYGIQFPDTSTPPPPMPEAFTLTPLDWTPPPPPALCVDHHTRGSRPVDEALRQGPDWIRLIRIKLLLDGYFRQRRAASEAAAGNLNGPVQTGPVSLDHLNGLKRAKRVIKPLPKRKNHHAVDDEEQQHLWQSVGGAGVVPLVGSVLGAALWNAGEVVVNGVKRLRDEFEEGGIGGRRKKMRID